MNFLDIIVILGMVLVNPFQHLNLAQGLLAVMQQNNRDQLAVAVLLARRRAARLVDRRGRRGRRMWVRNWVLERPLFGMHERLMMQLEAEDVAGFKNFIRLNPQRFQELLKRLDRRLTRQDTNFRAALTPGLKLSIALRYFNSGDNYHSLMYSFRVPNNRISKILFEVSTAIVDEFAMEVISCPMEAQEWIEIAEQFGARWQFHNALGALDGKHIRIRCPPNGGFMYYKNYKNFHSIILMALVDAEYKFIWTDTGLPGSHSDAQLFNHSELREAIMDGTLNLPAPRPLPGDDRPLPYFIIGDDAFALRTWMMKPYSHRNLHHDERIFNYRLSRARRIVENAFGILANRFQCLLGTMQQHPPTVTKIVDACVCLHNLLRLWFPGVPHRADREDQHRNVEPGAWRLGLHMEDVEAPHGGNRDTKAAKSQRAYLKHYYNSEAGRVDWQERMIT